MNESTTPTFAQFFDAWELFGTPALAGAVAGVLLGTLGIYVVMRRMVFLAAALSQAAGLGVALTVYVGAQLNMAASKGAAALGAAVFTGLAAAPFFTPTSQRSRRDALMGLTWLLGAAGALAVGSRIVDAEDVQALLFGSAVVVLPEQFTALCVLTCAVLAIHLWWMRAFIQVSFDREGARVRKLPVAAIDAVLLVTLALSISFVTRVLGALPVFAFSVLPAYAALRSCATVPRAFALAAVLGAVAGFGGYLVAFRLALPVGAAQALVAAALVGAAEVVRRLRNRR